MRLEQLCYPTPLPNVIATLSDISGLSESKLEQGYLEDIKKNRAANGRIWFNPANANFCLSAVHAVIRHHEEKPIEFFHRPHNHAFALWRMAMADNLGVPDSSIHFSQLFSIHPATLNKYESFKTSFPAMIEVALEEAGILDTAPGLATLNLFKNHRLFNYNGD